MKDTGAVAVINELIRGELLANHTYLVQSRLCRNWGYLKLGDLLQKEAADEMGHATRLIDRVVLLGGIPDMTREAVQIDTTVPEILELTVRLERKAVADYRQAAVACLKLMDVESMHMFQELAADEEGHLHWAESQLHLIEEIGIQNFLTEWI